MRGGVVTLDWVDLIAGAAIGAAAALGVRALWASVRGREADPAETSGPTSGSVPSAVPAVAVAPVEEPPGVPLGPTESPFPAATATTPVSRRAAKPVASVGRDTLRLSQRVVLHVYRQGALGPYEVAPVELCQLGIVRALDVRQSALTKVLTRLVAAGVLATDRRHVEGQPRRLKVYQLTPLGESLARDLRRTFPSQFMTEPRPATAPAAR